MKVNCKAEHKLPGKYVTTENCQIYVKLNKSALKILIKAKNKNKDL
jgi:hypothetical protein